MSVVRELSAAKLRPMLDSDVDAVMVIEKQVYPHGWNAGIFHDCLRVRYSCWVMELEGEMVGYGILSAGGGEAHILNVAVDPRFQGQGLGRTLMRFLLETARHHGADTVFLEVRPSNRIALRLYDSLGFNQVGLRRGYYPSDKGREDAIIMALSVEEIEV